ncbi:MAG TPA: SIS domain-containing protein [Thermoproteota archaeon]|nr:SIS domain-containing protein [Thermoproteota archaeon]
MKKTKKLEPGEKMIREVYEEPEAMSRTMASQMETIRSIARAVAVRHPSRLFFMGSGTSYHAGVIGAYTLNRFTGILGIPVLASEFLQFASNSIRPDDVLVVYSQSGESTDTLEALRSVKSKGAYVVGITNTMGSSLTRESNQSIVTQAGLEESVVATKTFLAQLAVTISLACLIAESGGYITREKVDAILQSINQASGQIRKELDRWKKTTQEIARKIKGVHDAFALGTGIEYGIALETGLKLKEATLTHSEAFSVAEFRHGPQSLVTKGVAVIMIAPEPGKSLESSEKLARELKEKKATVISVVEQDKSFAGGASDFVVRVPASDPVVSPILRIVPIQLLSYSLALVRKVNPDSPRNLTKVVR